MRNIKSRSWAATLVAMVTSALAVFAPAADAASVSLDAGHTDIFNVQATGDKLTLNVKEDITGNSVLRQPEDVRLVVKQAAYQKDTAAVKGINTAGYLLPLTQKPNLLWPGWDTLGVQKGGFNAININFVQVSGPGRVFLFSNGGFGGVEPLLRGGSLRLSSGSVREQSYPAHTHANWLFEKPGTYTMKVNATGVKNGKTYTSNTGTYTWTVEGNAAGGDAQPKPPVTPKDPAPGTPEKPGKPTKPGKPGEGNGTKPAPSKPGSPDKNHPGKGGETSGSTSSGSDHSSESASGSLNGQGSTDNDTAGKDGSLANTGVSPIAIILAVLGLGVALVGAAILGLRKAK